MKPVSDVELPSRSAWLGAVLAALFTIAGMLIEMRISLDVADIPRWQAKATALIALATLALLVARRRKPNAALITATFVINALATLITLYVTNPYYAMAASSWVPFQGNKLACLLVALLSPSFAIGFLAMLMFGGAGALQHHGFSPELQAKVGLTEPWMTWAFVMAGIVALVFRFGKMNLERTLLKAEAEAAAATRIAHMLLGIRDLMNTPLQSLEIATELLEDRGDDKVLERIRRAVKSLREVNDAIVEIEAKLPPIERAAAFDGHRLVRDATD